MHDTNDTVTLFNNIPLQKCKSQINPVKLWADINETVGSAWLIDGTSVLMSNEQSHPGSQALRRACKPAIEELENLVKGKVVHLMVNRLPPRTIVPIHTDLVKGSPQRFHLPLLTDLKHCYFWCAEYGIRHQESGFWHEVDYTVPHAIGNYGEIERIHLILDIK